MGKKEKVGIGWNLQRKKERSLPRATERRESGSGTTLPMDMRMVKCKSNVGLQRQVTVFLLKVRVF